MIKMKKVLSVMLAGAAAVTSLFCGSVSASAASSKDIVAKALEELQNSESVSYSYEGVTNYSEKDHKSTKYRHGVVQSDGKIDYAIYIDGSEMEKAWISYGKSGKWYRKSYSSSSFKSYTDSDYNEEQGTGKKYIEYILTHLKNVKISGTSDKYYTITASPDWKDSGLKKIKLTVYRKSGRLVKMVNTNAKKTYTYLNSTQTYTVTGGTDTYSGIAYSDMALSLPDELKGK